MNGGGFALLALALACGGPSAVAQEAGPAVTTYKFRSEALRQERSFHVHTPPGYADSDTRYPVLYLLDGGMDQWLPSTIATLDAIADEGQTGRLIIVGIASVNRPLDFDKRPDLMRRFLAEEVKPVVEEQYRTRGKGMIFGWSLGGLFVVDTLFEAPDMFDDFVAVSPSLNRNNRAMTRFARAKLAALPPGERRLWLSMGDEGEALGMDPLIGALKTRAPATLRWTYAPRTEETHGTVYLPALRDAVRSYYPPQPGAEAPARKSED
jgi:uncharacterized protein